ncbi:hypothetical protein KAW50_05115 [candidate division WOR-3 bacterium]|nr:hypothetical protein [candidate division WOR-3 bacterium]
MAFSLEQKSAYLIFFNATMISRSLGKSFGKGNPKLKKFKKATFGELEKLAEKMDNHTLTNKNIINSIKKLSADFNVSYGQTQKGLNVILKAHYYLMKNTSVETKKALDCPIDSGVLRRIDKETSLTKIGRSKYQEIQNEIQRRSNIKIEFDIYWDIQNLKRAGLL